MQSPPQNFSEMSLTLIEFFKIVSNQLSPWRRVLLEKLVFAQYGIRRYISMYTTARHRPIPGVRLILSALPIPTSLRPISKLSFRLIQWLPSGLVASGLPDSRLSIQLTIPRRNTLVLQSIFTLTYNCGNCHDITIFEFCVCPYSPFSCYRRTIYWLRNSLISCCLHHTQEIFYDKDKIKNAGISTWWGRPLLGL
jgi:hypothetical protein